MKFNDLYDYYLNKFNSYFKTFLDDKDYIYQETLYNSMEYSLFSGGKRIRPVLVLSSTDMFSGDFQDGLFFASIIEMIHTYSLIHDDLPAMDNDDFRRGKASNHIVFGEDISILAGDSLLNTSFEMGLERIYKEKSNNHKNKLINILRNISIYSGKDGMIGGQIIDIENKIDDYNEEKLLLMYKKKTSGLFIVSLLTGAMLGNASFDEIDLIKEFGYNLGLAFQIKDDILDYDEDLKIKKPTYPILFGLENAKEKVKSLSYNSKGILEKLSSRDTYFLNELTNHLIYRNK